MLSPQALPEGGDQIVIAHLAVRSRDGLGAGQAGLAGRAHQWLHIVTALATVDCSAAIAFSACCIVQSTTHA